MALFVLGAGATRGASFVDPSKDPCLPPLDADFFTQLQRVRAPKHQKLIDAVIKDVVELFGLNFSVTLETAFATLEHTLRMVATTGETSDFRKDILLEKRDRLLQAIAAIMEESLTGSVEGRSSSRQMRDCEGHGKLVEKILSANDEMISFNYDCLIDHTLKQKGGGKWNPRYGYGFNLGGRGANLTGDGHWCPSPAAEEGETLRLYKLHGSLHFRIEGPKVALKQRPYTKQHGNLRFNIIPPEYHKAYDQGVFGRLWKEAGQAIHRTHHIVMVGYSLPPSDLHSTALFQISVRKGSLEALVIVNPDPAARRRTRTVLQRGLTERTRILVFDKLAEFVEAGREMWDRTA